MRADMGDGSDAYTTWLTDFESDVDNMQQVALKKIGEERKRVWDLPPFTDDQDDSGPGSYLDQAVRGLKLTARVLARADVNELAELKKSLNLVRVLLVGEVHPDEAGAETRFGGQFETHEKITVGVDSWGEKTGEMFKNNYVRPIPTQLSNQATAIELASKYLSDANEVVVTARYVLGTIPQTAIEALEEYSPYKDKYLDAMSTAFMTLGVPASPGPSVLLAVGSKRLPAISGQSVNDLMEHVCEATDKFEENLKSVEQVVIKELNSARKNDEEKWQNLVCKRPAGD